MWTSPHLGGRGYRQNRSEMACLIVTLRRGSEIVGRAAQKLQRRWRPSCRNLLYTNSTAAFLVSQTSAMADSSTSSPSSNCSWVTTSGTRTRITLEYEPAVIVI